MATRLHLHLHLQPRLALGSGLALGGVGLSRLGEWLRCYGDNLRLRAAAENAGRRDRASAGKIARAPGGKAAGVAGSAEQSGPLPTLDPTLLASWLWGEGNVMPGTAAEIQELVRPFNLKSGGRLLHLGAGLGGGCEAIATANKCKVSGYERDPALVTQGTAYLAPSKRVTISAIGPNDPRPSGPRWDHCLSRFAFHAAPDRRKLLTNCRSAMLPGGHIALVDYVAPGPSKALSDWSARLSVKADPWTADRWRRAFAAAGFDLRIEEDIGARHRANILVGWHGLLTGPRLKGIPRRQLAPMVNAAERWIGEAMLVETGALQVIRFYAILPS